MVYFSFGFFTSPFRDLLADSQVAGYPDTLALAFDPLARYLTCVYSNHSVYVWDVCNIRNVEVVYSAHSHSNGVWSVEVHVILYLQNNIW